MAHSVSPKERKLRILASLMVVLFAGILVLRLSPWGWPEQGGLVTAANAAEQEHEVVDVTLQLKDGPVELELWKDVAPKTVERITTLARQGFYDGIVFHRVIDGFMAQTGDPTGTGMGGSDLPDLPAEFSNIPFERGILGMARTSDPNSANSQFFIMFAPAPNLNGQYTVFGKVVSGMEHVDNIKKGDPAANGMVDDPDKIVSMTVDSE